MFSVTRLLIVLVIGLSALTSMASGEIILGVSASSNTSDQFGTTLTNVLDGTGLTGGVPSLTDTHEDTEPANSWVGGALLPEITFDFGGLRTVDGFSFWNQNAGGPGASGESGINLLLVQYSTNGLIYLPVLGAPVSFAQVTTIGPVGPEVFSFAAVDATHLRFTVLSNHGGSETGFAEVQFHTPVPESAGGQLLLPLALGLLRCRSRAARLRIQ